MGEHHHRARSFSQEPQKLSNKQLTQEAPQPELPPVTERLPEPKEAKYRFREFELADRVFVVTGQCHDDNPQHCRADPLQVVDKV
jgi:hypothetical protein